MANKPKDRATTPHRVSLLVPTGVLPLDLVVPLTAFSRWADHVYTLTGIAPHPYEVSLAGTPGTTCGPLLAVQQLLPLSSVAEAQTVVVPGTVDPLQPVPVDVLEALREAHDRGARVVSICTGAFILAAAGLLAGRAATTHWAWADRLKQMYPDVDARPDELYVDEGDVVTSAGMLAGVDLCLHVLRADHGQQLANSVARFLVSAPHREGGQAQFIEGLALPDGGDDMADVAAWMLQHLDEALTLTLIAQHARSSVRTLTRRFRAATGSSVLDWLIMQRVVQARTLLETTDLPVTDIARRCGFVTGESLRFHFLERTSTTPSRYRSAFR